MVDIFVAALFVAAVLGMRPVTPLTRINEDYISLETCSELKGLFALVVVLHHLAQSISDGLAFPAFRALGVMAVAVFLFVSGYGSMRGHMRSREYIYIYIYIRGYAKKRLYSVVLPYIIVILIYWLASLVTRGAPYSAREVLLSLVNGAPIADNSWYMILCIIFYAVFFVCAKLLGGRYRVIAYVSALFCCGWIALCKALGYECFWYYSIFAFPAGMLWAVYGERLAAAMSDMKKYIAALLGTFILFAALSLLRDRLSNQFAVLVCDLVRITLFPCLAFLVCMKLRLNSPVLRFYGKISLELYLIHGLFISIFRGQYLYIDNDIVYSALVLLCSTLAAIPLQRLFKWLSGLGADRKKA